MKRLFSLILAITLLLCACAPAPADTEKPDTKKPDQTPTDNPPEKISVLSSEVMPLDALFNYGLVCIKVGEKWGFANMQGEIVIAPQFANPCKFSQGVLPAQKDDKWGYINTKGEWVIEPQFDRTTGFREGYALVMDYIWGTDGRPVSANYKLINGYGEVIITLPERVQCYPVYDGMFPTRTEDDHIIFYNTAGEEVLNVEASLFNGSEETWQVFYDGLMVAQQNDKWGYVNLQGEWVIEPQFEIADPFMDGIAQVQVDGKAGYIDKTGNFVIEPQYEYDYHDPGEGLIGVKSNDWQGYIDYEGNRVIDLSTYEYVNPGEFRGGIAVVSVKEGSRFGYGVIDKTGNFIVQPTYSTITRYNCGLASFETADRRHGYLDTNGNEIVPANYHWTTKYYDDGYGVVMDDEGKFSILDTNGQPIFDAKFDGIGNYYVSAYENGLMHCTTGR